MNPEDVLGIISEQLGELDSDTHGAVLLVRLDRGADLRQRFGLSGMFEVVDQIGKQLKKRTGRRGKVLRFGLGSFFMVIPAKRAIDVGKRAEKLFSLLTGQEFAVGDERLAVSVSIAACRPDPRFADVDSMLSELAVQVDELVKDGGNQWRLVEPNISASHALTSSDQMLRLLRDALEADALRVVFQPLLATSGDDSVRAYQMLPRLATSDGQLIAAAEFIPLARSAGLLPVIDRWVMAHAIRLLKGPFADQSIRLFVNQSEALVADPERQAWLEKRFQKTNALRERLVVELRIDDAMAHLDGATRVLEAARKRGFGVSLSMVDEHSRWDLLAGELRADYLRISGAFVKRLGQEPEVGTAFLETSRAVRETGTRIIMPMVEDQATAASLWRSGADFMQGNMIQAPEDTIQLSE